MMVDGNRFEINIVDAHYLASVNVDDLLVEQVAFEEQVSFRSLAGKLLPSVGRQRGMHNPALD